MYRSAWGQSYSEADGKGATSMPVTQSCGLMPVSTARSGSWGMHRWEVDVCGWGVLGKSRIGAGRAEMGLSFKEHEFLNTNKLGYVLAWTFSIFTDQLGWMRTGPVNV